MTDKIWAVAAGEYSDYRILGVFEDREDAYTVAARSFEAPGFGNVYVQEFEFYRSGDRSMRPCTTWRYYLEVHEDGTIHECASDVEPGYCADERVFDHYDPTDRRHTVHGVGATEEQARKGAYDRAAQVAALVIEGVDPREIQRYGRGDD